jgi:hypothetical protein
MFSRRAGRAISPKAMTVQVTTSAGEIMLSLATAVARHKAHHAPTAAGLQDDQRDADDA